MYPPGCGRPPVFRDLFSNPRGVRRSILGETQSVTPMVVPVRGYLDDIRGMMVGDYYIGRGSRERNLRRSIYANEYKVAQYGRSRVIQQFALKLRDGDELRARLWTLSGLRLVCHCRATQECHADVIFQEFRRAHPGAFDRDDADGETPTSAVLNCLARLRMEPEPDEESSADENVPEKGAGWKGVGAPMIVGAGYASREYCDGQTLASPGRWPIAQRRYPESALLEGDHGTVYGLRSTVG